VKAGGLLAILEKPKKGESDDTEEAPESGADEGTSYEDAAADVADILDVPEDKRKALGLALRRLVMCCHDEE
jgi:hypothetical protein